MTHTSPSRFGSLKSLVRAFRVGSWKGIPGLLPMFVLVIAQFALSGPVRAQVSDTLPPQVQSLSLNATVINTTAGAQNLVVDCRVTDDLSGVGSIQVGVSSPSGVQQTFVFGVRISGDSLDGVYRSTIPIPQFAESGSWQIVELVLIDTANNVANVFTPALQAMGFPTTFEVISTTDVEPPGVTGISFSPDPIDVSAAPQDLSITLRLTDNLAGVDVTTQPFFIVFTVTGPAGQTRFFSNSVFTLVGGDILDGFWNGTLSVPRFSESGLWQFTLLFKDAAGNRMQVGPGALAAMGLPTGFNVVSVPDDSEAPQLTSLTIQPSFVDTSTSNQLVQVSLGVTDNLAGARGVGDATVDSPMIVLFQSPSGNSVFNINFNLVSGTPLNGVWQQLVFFPRFSEAGTWKIAFLRISDTTGNTFQACTSLFCPAGFPTPDSLGFPIEVVVIQPSLVTDGTISSPSTGGTIFDDVFGARAQVTVPAGAFTQPTDIAIDVFSDPLDIPTPSGFQSVGTKFVNISLTPQPAFPLAAPGLTIVLPVENALPADSSLQLFKVDTATGVLVPTVSGSGLPVTGTVDASGLSATFTGIASLSTVVGLVPSEQTPRQKIEALIVSVNSLVTAGKLKSAQGRVLTGTLNLAIRNLDQGRTKLAVLALKAFIVEVKLLVRLKRLANADGQPLIDAAAAIVAQLK